MSLRDLPSLLRRRASSTVRDGWKVIRPGRSRQSVSSTDLGPSEVNRLRQTALSKSAGKLKREDEAESFLPGTIGSSPTARLQRSSAAQVPDMPFPGEEMSSVPTPSTGSSGVLGALAPESPPSMLRSFAGLEHVTYFSDVQRPGSRPRPRPCFLHLEAAK
ncbi:unnamed protein product [Cladocopium goreaui]|uniref:Uncharacterized protein n=1 Tax=Cladocopium goreaui TaxID=2562237 RepID=A0A9P1GM57_9DINO|nr:unnamed protein product [Cladocopium goreaui]